MMIQSKRTQFIYVWRLDLEKWVDVIIEVFSKLSDQRDNLISLDIFWRGLLATNIEELAAKYKNITYHWFQKKTIVFDVRKNMDYCLMPSRFLETFGLSALDSLSVWVPIISPSKWGLTAFVLPRLVLNEVTTNELLRVVTNASELNTTSAEYLDLRKQSKEIYSQFTWSSWYSKVCELWLTKNLMVVSDYGANLGWIETLIEEIDNGLTKENHLITQFVATNKQLTQTQRYRWLIKTILNVWSAYRISSVSKKSALVWRHSVHRQLWRLPLWISSTRSKHWIMIHDMWLLHPFPAFVEDEAQIVKASNLLGWIQEWVKVKWWARLPLLIAKRISVSFIRRQIISKKMIIQLPSEYLKKHIQRKVSSTQEVVVVPHFILPHMH